MRWSLPLWLGMAWEETFCSYEILWVELQFQGFLVILQYGDTPIYIYTYVDIHISIQYYQVFFYTHEHSSSSSTPPSKGDSM